MVIYILYTRSLGSTFVFITGLRAIYQLVSGVSYYIDS